LEAMNLANGDSLARMLNEGAAALMSKHKTRDELIRQVYAVALTRQPTENEWGVAHSMVGEKMSPESVEDFLWVVFMLPEFNYVN